MVSITFSIITFLLAASSTALSAASLKKSPNNKFIIALIAEGYPLLELRAIESGAEGWLDLVFGYSFEEPYTKAYLQGGKVKFDLPYVQKPGIYGMVLPPPDSVPPENYSYVGPVYAKYGEATKGFSILENIGPLLVAKPNFEDFYVCNRTVPKEKDPRFILARGYIHTKNVTMGCVLAELKTYAAPDYWV